MLVLAVAAIATAALSGRSGAADPKAPVKVDPQRYLRVVDGEDDRIGLEIATREFVLAGTPGPRVALVAVAHIGERPFYSSLEQLLNQYDVVLYESVLPPGARGPGGDTDEQRVESTRVAMQFVATLIEAYGEDRRAYPDDLAALRQQLAAQDDRLAGWTRAASVDAWGRGVRYEVARDDRGRATAFALTSLGADGRTGGEGPAADIVVSSEDGLAALRLEQGENLQAELAAALGLSFQLEAIDYGRDSWRCSDMAMDEVARELAARGIAFEPLAGALTGSSLPAKVISFLLRLVRMADTFFGGVIADTAKIALIEMLGNDAVMAQALDDMGEGFSEVIVGMRNQVAVDDLKSIMRGEPSVDSVAIFYGAAHMPDLEQRLAALGYRPASPEDEASDVRWLRAIEVDLNSSAVTRRDVEQMRMMMQQMAR
jgi:hypothetical protein